MTNVGIQVGKRDGSSHILGNDAETKEEVGASVALNGGMFDGERLSRLEQVVLGLCEGISFVDPDDV